MSKSQKGRRRKKARKSHPDATLGTRVDEVSIDIDYQIIEHFSKHLYGSPNKAVEELVSNGFDAFAGEVRVYVPGPLCPAHVVVWDDGASMDTAGLKGLWLIASSPKTAVGRVARGPQGTEREMIGKFGIGKLAAYSVGRSIAHLCRIQDDYFLVAVDFAALTGENLAGPTIPRTEPVRRPILKLTTAEVEAYVGRLFDSRPASLSAMLQKEHWTFAIIGDLRQFDRPGDLSPGMLSWILGNGMPLRPDFQVFVNDAAVESRLARDGIVGTWDFAKLEDT